MLRKPKGRSLGERAEHPGEAAGEAEGGVQVCRYARISLQWLLGLGGVSHTLPHGREWVGGG